MMIHVPAKIQLDEHHRASKCDVTVSACVVKRVVVELGVWPKLFTPVYGKILELFYHLLHLLQKNTKWQGFTLNPTKWWKFILNPPSAEFSFYFCVRLQCGCVETTSPANFSSFQCHLAAICDSFTEFSQIDEQVSRSAHWRMPATIQQCDVTTRFRVWLTATHLVQRRDADWSVLGLQNSRDFISSNRSRRNPKSACDALVVISGIWWLTAVVIVTYVSVP